MKAVQDLFGDDSDDEQHHRQAGSKRPRSSEPNSAVDEKVKEVADKLADFVAKNGKHYEDLTRQRNPGNTPFKFLWDKSSREYKYYEDKLNSLLRAAGAASSSGGDGDSSSRSHRHHSSSHGHDRNSSRHGRDHSSSRHERDHDRRSGSSGQHHQHSLPSSSGREDGQVQKRSRWGAPPPASYAGAPPAGGSSGAPGGNTGTLSAMDEYMRRLDAAAAQKKREDEEEEEERRRRAAQPLLKETAFDRRKTVAVYKDDGQRGHHMGDYIPKEELAKFMAKCGDTQLQQQVETKAAIGADNIGHKLLQKMGWKEGKGIGAKEDGRTAPVAATGPGGAAAAAAAAGLKQDTLGLGAQAHGAVEESDDPFEQYRKRMMLGYKYRPNPLGNPRKPYY